MTATVHRPVLLGQRALVVGIANEHSIAYGCARVFRALGAELAMTYLNEKSKRFVEPLAHDLGATILEPCDVGKDGELEAVTFWDSPGFVVLPHFAWITRRGSCAFAAGRDRPGRSFDA
jgi:hypothetical protein